MAAEHGLEFLSCKGEDAAMKCLDEGKKYAVMVVANQIKDGGSFRVIETARVSVMHAQLPIAFIMSDRDLRLAHDALTAGATEIFSRSEQDQLMSFIGDYATELDNPQFGGKVLLVEDSEVQAEYVEGLCRSLGMSVDRAEDVDTAQSLFDGNPYQLVVIDVALKGRRSGIALVKSIRQNPVPRQPILVMSAFDDLPRRLRALKSGADDFISKPFAPEEFVWRIKRLMQLQTQQDYNNHAPAIPDKRGVKLDFAEILSPREAEICGNILAGTSDREIASKLGISFWTVRSHIQQIFTKTGALNRREVMVRFMPSAVPKD
jgi:DNA-binding NarL/FixJ family response regulator